MLHTANCPTPSSWHILTYCAPLLSSPLPTAHTHTHACTVCMDEGDIDIDNFNFIGEGLCRTASGKALPSYWSNDGQLTQQKCASKCRDMPGTVCDGFASHVSPRQAACFLYGSTFAGNDQPPPGWFSKGNGGTGPITKISTAPFFCYAHSDATIPPGERKQTALALTRRCLARCIVGLAMRTAG